MRASAIMAGASSAALVASLTLLAPDTASSAPDPRSPAVMFAIGTEQADRVIHDALAREFPEARVRRVTAPGPGFAITGRYAIHSYAVSAHRIPAIARQPDGSLVEGFRFEVRASGTMSRALRTRAARLSSQLHRDARLIASPLPVVGDAPPEPHGPLAARSVPDWLVVVALALGLFVGMAAGSRLSRLGEPLRRRLGALPGATVPSHERPPYSDRSWWSSELLEMTHDAVIVWEMDGAGILYWNAAAEELYGFDRDAVHGKVTHELLRTQLAGSVTELERRLARHGMWVGDLIHTTREGRQIEVEGRLALLSQRNGRWLVLEVNRDVTDRRRAAAARSAMEDRMMRLRTPAAPSAG